MGTAVAGAGGIIIAKGVAMLKDFGKEMLQSYDSASKLSDNIGVAADSIIGLRYAADLSSVGSENMDKNMAKLAQTISKAGNGSKEASATFAKMGIAVKNSGGNLKNSEDAMARGKTAVMFLFYIIYRGKGYGTDNSGNRSSSFSQRNGNSKGYGSFRAWRPCL